MPQLEKQPALMLLNNSIFQRQEADVKEVVSGVASLQKKKKKKYHELFV